MNTLVIDQLSFERDDIVLFENISAEWRSGDIVQLVGANGSGKTTLMRILTGILSPLSGGVLLNGQQPNSYDFRSSLLYLGHHVGIKATMTPYENLHWYFALNGAKDNTSANVNADACSVDALEAALKGVGLAAYRDVPCYQLSAGQQRRVALARLAISQAPLWVLDEPFTAIDVEGVSRLEKTIEQHAERGGIVVLTTHQAWCSQNVRVLNMEAFSSKRSGES